MTGGNMLVGQHDDDDNDDDDDDDDADDDDIVQLSLLDLTEGSTVHLMPNTLVGTGRYIIHTIQCNHHQYHHRHRQHQHHHYHV